MSLPPILGSGVAPVAPSGMLAQVTQAVLAVAIVGATVALYLLGKSVPPELLVLASAVVVTYFAGASNRQINGTAVAALTSAVQAHLAATTPAPAAPTPAPATTAAPVVGAAPVADGLSGLPA